MNRIEQLEEKLKPFEEMKAELDEYQEKLHQLYLKGVINEEGNLVAHSPPNDVQEEREMNF